MVGLKVTLKDSCGKWLGGLGGIFRRKGAEAGSEISSKERPEPRGEAEEALWQAMGWNEPQGGSGAHEVVSRAAAEALRV
jgi:hypothetical protein